MSAEERDYGKLAQTPAADRDWEGHCAGHDYEQDHRIATRQRKALRTSARPTAGKGDGVAATCKAQDHGPLRSEQTTMEIRGQRCEPAGISPPSKRRCNFRREQET